ncbi:putative drug exporter of the RND superfamily [Actinacidiphila yanglinensis]|uniref:Putative drug exporter of the RND superfamily n=1 Tax=Actinacidiphila yanglinensis TaxID=310779 RepID=A0A1H6E629_9ACTN|nr:MMPL family transporter [Actinacidiphila yanglinensis]SEG93097.1 putative drug exporter of the RND superfamily [Actinacidiphila yanglinensis]
MLGRIVRLALTRTRLVLILSAVAVVVMGAVGVGAFGKLESGGFDDPSAPSSRAKSLIDREFGGEADLVLLVTPDGGPQSAAATRAGRALTADLKHEPTVDEVTSYWDAPSAGLTSKDGRKVLVLAHIKGNDNQTADRTKTITDRYTGERGAITVQAGGAVAVSNDVDSQVTKDLATAESIAVPVTLILLVLVFGSFVAALLPLVIGVIAVMGTFAELDIIGSFTDVSVFAINITTALGLGLGIDYALLIVNRFREHLADGISVPDALERTVRSAGRTIVFSSSTVAAAMAALLVFPQYFLRSFAYAGIGVVVIAATSAVVVIPALLAALGQKVNAGRLPGSSTVRRSDAPLWGRIATAAMRKPAFTALPALVILLALASPLLKVTFGSPDERVLPTTAQSRIATESLDRDFASNDSAALQLVTKGAVGKDALGGYAARLSRLPGVAQVEASTGTYTAGARKAPSPQDAALSRPRGERLTVAKSPGLSSGSAQTLVRSVRALPAPAGASVLVGGSDAELVDAKHAIASRLPLAIGWIVATTFVLLFLFTGSVVQPLRALVLNSVSLCAAIGAMVWVFQDGHLSGLLGFTPMPMDTSMTVLMFCVAFGLSMDYEVFVTSRIKELHDAGADTASAVAGGLSRTGRLVTMAAVLLGASFFAFGTGKVSFIQMFGLGSGLAILIDAVAVRGILVPAAMRLLGRAAWYAPGPLRRLHARAGLSDADPADLPPQPAAVPTGV